MAMRFPPGKPRAASTPLSTKARGNIGENAAVAFLAARKFQIIARNWRPGNALRGEVDCVAWDTATQPGRVLCFIEIKTRKSNTKGAPQEAVNFAKQRQLSRLANAFVSYHKLPEVPCRFDVVEVWLDAAETEKRHEVRCVLHRNAFDYCGDFQMRGRAR